MESDPRGEFLSFPSLALLMISIDCNFGFEELSFEDEKVVAGISIFRGCEEQPSKKMQRKRLIHIFCIISP
jgi:hypothetical protein